MLPFQNSNISRAQNENTRLNERKWVCMYSIQFKSCCSKHSNIDFLVTKIFSSFLRSSIKETWIIYSVQVTGVNQPINCECWNPSSVQFSREQIIEISALLNFNQAPAQMTKAREIPSASLNKSPKEMNFASPKNRKKNTVWLAPRAPEEPWLCVRYRAQEKGNAIAPRCNATVANKVRNPVSTWKMRQLAEPESRWRLLCPRGCVYLNAPRESSVYASPRKSFSPVSPSRGCDKQTELAAGAFFIPAGEMETRTGDTLIKKIVTSRLFCIRKLSLRGKTTRWRREGRASLRGGKATFWPRQAGLIERGDKGTVAVLPTPRSQGEICKNIN